VLLVWVGRAILATPEMRGTLETQVRVLEVVLGP